MNQPNYTQVAADLRAAKALIDSPEKWIQGNYGRNAVGGPDGYNPEKWACMCSIGAVCKQKNVPPHVAEKDPAIRLLDEQVGGGYCAIADYNDAHTHEEVMTVWDKAIAKADALAIVQNLEAARAKIDTPEKWTQGASARDSQGRSVGTTEESATCFCTFGALKAVAGYEYNPALFVLREAVDMNPIKFNDTFDRKHDEVLEMFDRAIALAKGNADAI